MCSQMNTQSMEVCYVTFLKFISLFLAQVKSCWSVLDNLQFNVFLSRPVKSITFKNSPMTQSILDGDECEYRGLQRDFVARGQQNCLLLSGSYNEEMQVDMGVALETVQPNRDLGVQLNNKLE